MVNHRDRLIRRTNGKSPNHRHTAVNRAIGEGGLPKSALVFDQLAQLAHVRTSRVSLTEASPCSASALLACAS